jgi:hypothetical protein
MTTEHIHAYGHFTDSFGNPYRKCACGSILLGRSDQ